MIKSVELVTVSKQVAEALKAVSEHNTASEIIEGHFEGGWTGQYGPLGMLTLDELIRAVYVGYEVEKSAHEKVKELYGSFHVGSMSGERFDEGAEYGIEQVLKIIGMKVEGINDGN